MERYDLQSSVNYQFSYTRYIFKVLQKSWKVLIFIAAYSFLAYKLLTFNQYHELFLQIKQTTIIQFWWLLAVFVLLPVNWFLEAIKWKKLTSNVQKLKLSIAIKSVLVGISTGFFTPNRVGELLGRIMFLDSENRKAGVTLSLVNSLTQNLIMTLCGIPACIFYFNITNANSTSGSSIFLLVLILVFVIFGMFYFALPNIGRQFSKSRFVTRITDYVSCLSTYNSTDLILIILISLMRYFVFCTQFFLLLRFFNIQLELWQALIAIPTNYLFVTFTPSVAFSEAAVRSSYAVLVIGFFSSNIVGIALAGMCIWMINFVIPMMVGSIIMVRNR
jgi:uncharacterized membrane protein YbhN (UPF0104 family)